MDMFFRPISVGIRGGPYCNPCQRTWVVRVVGEVPHRFLSEQLFLQSYFPQRSLVVYYHLLQSSHGWKEYTTRTQICRQHSSALIRDCPRYTFILVRKNCKELLCIIIPCHLKGVITAHYGSISFLSTFSLANNTILSVYTLEIASLLGSIPSRILCEALSLQSKLFQHVPRQKTMPHSSSGHH